MKTIIYQTIPRLFGNFNEQLVKNGNLSENGCGKFKTYTDKALAAIKELGVTHIWFTGIIRHATCTDYQAYGIAKDHRAVVKGKAGSPYSIKDYYDVDCDLAVNVENRMSEFESLIKRTHKADMKVIIDFVPNHLARSYKSLMKPAYIRDLGENDDTNRAFAHTNNFYYLPGQHLELKCEDSEEEYFDYSEFPAKVTGNDCFKAVPNCNDWYETVKLNYGIDYQNGHQKNFTPVPDTWHKMLDILLFWVDKNIDGFRCDMAEMVPVEFWEWVIPQVKSRKNVCFIAEVYNPSLYRDFIHRGKFDMLYDKVGMYDTLRDIICWKSNVDKLILCWRKTEDIQKNMLYFLENHDEQRIASDFFAGNSKTSLPAFACLSMLNSNPVMIYNGQELGERGMDEEGFSGRDGRTTIFDYWSMKSIRDWANEGNFDGGKSTQEELSLRNEYKKILRMVNDEKALSEGSFYGLDFCNDYPSNRITTFLRKHENELILVIINFDNEAHEVTIRIPDNAFNTLEIPDNAVSKTKNLITGEETVSALTQHSTFRTKVESNYYNIFKFNLLTQ
ncbi:MAG: alpha-amylase [Tannerella sp.]|jgi:glycosidase|nr:alpha-amylase [Tannerella sp.]